jgi:hypothetical protein
MTNNPTPRTDAGKRLLAEYERWFADQGWEAEGWDPEASAAEMARAIVEIEAEAAPAPDGLREAAADLYRIAVGEHGHDETHSADWPACLPAHIAFNRYRAALAARLSKTTGEPEP